MENPTNKIKIFTMGGSIDKNYSMLKSDFIVDAPQIKHILTDSNITVQYEIEEVVRKDSLEITDTDLEVLLAKVEKELSKLIVITHGTDTMHLTGQVLKNIKGKVIVLTGAMQPAQFKNSDSQFNVGFAIAAVQTLKEGVYLVMNGQIFNPLKVKKNMATKAFESI